MKKTLVLLVLVAVFAGAMAGCTKFTPKRYSMIRTGMTELEVEKILGPPYHKFSDSWTYTHEDPFYRAKIRFENGRVADKAWTDEKGIADDPDAKVPIGETPKVKVDRKIVID